MITDTANANAARIPRLAFSSERDAPRKNTDDAPRNAPHARPIIVVLLNRLRKIERIWVSDFDADNIMTPITLTKIAAIAIMLILSPRKSKLKKATWTTSVFEYIVPTAKLLKEKR